MVGIILYNIIITIRCYARVGGCPVSVKHGAVQKTGQVSEPGRKKSYNNNTISHLLSSSQLNMYYIVLYYTRRTCTLYTQQQHNLHCDTLA